MLVYIVVVGGHSNCWSVSKNQLKTVTNEKSYSAQTFHGDDAKVGSELKLKDDFASISARF